MSKNVATLIAILAVLAPVSCSKEDDTRVAGHGQVTICLGDDITRAAATENEKKISSLELFAFNNGSLSNRYRFTSQDLEKKKATVSLRGGSYSLYLVGNGPSTDGVTSETALLSLQAPLAECNSLSSGFLMTASGSVSALKAGEEKNMTMNLDRAVARVMLSSVTDATGGSCGKLTVVAAFLSNVPSMQTVGGTFDNTASAASLWYNRDGRSDGVKSHMIDGVSYSASCPGLTWASIGASVTEGGTWNGGCSLYTYPNPNPTFSEGWTSSFSPQASALVVIASLGTETYYYTVPLGVLESNKNYNVNAVIYGGGSLDPDVPLSPMSITYTVAEWTSGADYEDTI